MEHVFVTVLEATNVRKIWGNMKNVWGKFEEDRDTREIFKGNTRKVKEKRGKFEASYRKNRRKI